MIGAVVLIVVGVAVIAVADRFVEEAGPRGFVDLTAMLILLVGLGRMVAWALTTSVAS